MRSVALAVVVVTSACVSDVVDDDLVVGASGVIDEGVIVGAVDWVSATSLSGVQRQASRATGFVRVPEALARCSGFLIAPDLLMTNHHCIPSAHFAARVTANFTYESRWDESGLFTCDEYVTGDADLDYAVVRCRGRPGDTYGVLSLGDAAVGENTRVELFHQQCDFFADRDCLPLKKMSPGRITGGIGATRLTHDADMLGGSSGGPLVAAGTTRVVAINNAEMVKDNTGRGTTNLAVPMSRIVAQLRAQHVFDDAAADDCAAVPAAGRVIDEDDGCVTLGGDARWLRSVEDAGDGGDLVWTGTTANATAGNFARYDVHVAAAGRYELAVALDADYGTASVARYRVAHAGAVDTVAIAQAGKDGFVVLGTYAFAGADADEYVRVDDNTGVRGEHLVFDALRVRPAAAACARVQVTGASQLNVRADPSTQHAPVGVLAGGEIVARTETTRGQTIRDTSDWFRVEKPGLAGYISAAYAVCVAEN